mmetsp:Transcript_7179/g.21895  ORF Transcript_7179/g.21895 Transcript_7179/m.21895 type:complete len:544 (-) Transcript_7179:31-1662(-)
MVPEWVRRRQDDMTLLELPDDVLNNVLRFVPPQKLCQSVMLTGKELQQRAVEVFNSDPTLFFNVNLGDKNLLKRRQPLPFKRIILSRRKRSGVSLNADEEVLQAIANGNWASWLRQDIVSLSLHPTDEFQQTSVSPLLRDICRFTELVRLDLSGLWIADVIESFQSLPNLKEMVLRGSSTTIDELKQLSRLRKLKLLDLSFLQVYDRECGELLQRPEPLALVPKQIETLFIHDFNLERKLVDGSFSCFAKFAELKVLNLRSMCFFAVCNFEFLRSLVHLEKLCLDTGGYAGDWNSMVDFARAVHNPSKLQHVTLTKAAGDFHVAFKRSRFPHLRTLNLTGSSINVGIPTEDLVELEEINLSFCSVVNAQCMPVKTAKALNLRHCRYLSSRFMEVLGECYQLERLLLDGNDSNATNLRKLHRLKRLRVLSVQSPWVGNLGLKTIAFLKNIEFLSAKDCNLNDLGLKHLETLQRLRFANLTGNSFTGEAAQTLSRMKHMERFLVDSGPGSKLSKEKKQSINNIVTREFSIAEYGMYPKDELYPPH